MSKKDRYRFLHRESRRWEQFCVNTEYCDPSPEAWAGLMLRNYGIWALDHARVRAKLEASEQNNYYALCLPVLQDFFN